MSPATPTVTGWGSEARVGIAFLGARKDLKFVFMAGNVTTEDGKGYKKCRQTQDLSMPDKYLVRQ